MAAREEQDKGSQLPLFSLHSTTLNILGAQSQNYEELENGGVTLTEFWKLIKGNRQ